MSDNPYAKFATPTPADGGAVAPDNPYAKFAAPVAATQAGPAPIDRGFPYDKPGTVYGNVLPFAKDEKTGDVSVAVPEMIRSPLRGMISAGKKLTGAEAYEGSGLTPDEWAAMMAVGGVKAPADFVEGAAVAPVAAKPPSATRRLIDDFTKTGVDPNLATVSSSVPVKAASHVLHAVPLASGRIESGVNKMLGQTAEATVRTAEQYGKSVTPESAGRGVEAGIQAFAKSDRGAGMTPEQIIAAPTRETSFATKADALYDAFAKEMPADTEFHVPATLNALKGPVERFPTNPALGSSITNSKLQQWFQVIAPKVEEEAPKFSSLVETAGRPLLMQAAQELESGGKLTFGEMQEFRSYIGRLLGEPGLVSDIPRADLKAVYGALSHDMLAAAHDVGPRAVATFERANAYYKAGIDRIDVIESVLGKNRGPDQIFHAVNTMASDTARGNIASLRALQRSLGPDEWGDVASTVLRRMGEPTPSQANMASVNFSPGTFVTNWSKLTPAAKDVLFGIGVARENLERLVRVVNAEKQTAKYANVSRSAVHGGLLATAAGMGTSPVTTTLSLLGARAGAEALMNPSFVKWLISAPRPPGIPGVPVESALSAMAPGAVVQGLAQPPPASPQPPPGPITGALGAGR